MAAEKSRGPTYPGSPKPGDIGRDRADAGGIYHDETISVHAPRAEAADAWVERMNRSGAVPLCACGCGRGVVLRGKHRTAGLPKYVHGHHPNPLRRGFEELRNQGYRLVGDVTAALGVSATTLRRMEAEGAIPKAKRIEISRGKGVRAYSDAEFREIMGSRVVERWQAKHPGRWERCARRSGSRRNA
jgi:hypothetical protein